MGLEQPYSLTKTSLSRGKRFACAQYNDETNKSCYDDKKNGGCFMKILSYLNKEEKEIGIKHKHGIIPVSALGLSEVISSVHTLIERPELMDELEAKLKVYEGSFLKVSEISLLPALTDPEKLICVGLNYKKHADEVKATYPDYPVLFSKFNNALSAHQETVLIPETTERLDYEVELGVVIGKTVKNIEANEALDAVFGYTTSNDLSARDLQKRSGQWLLGKTSDGFLPVGPYLVTKDEIKNPNQLKLGTELNGEKVQDSNTSDMIFSVEEIISYVSKHMTLKPGDLIMTGTPEGVIIGRPYEERNYIKPGDEVTVEVEGLGRLTSYFK